MKKEIFPSVMLTGLCLILFCVVYPALVWGVAQLAPGKGEGITLTDKNSQVHFQNIGQSFTQDQYFWSRPSAVNYNAAATGGSNKGPSNPEYLATVQERIDSFLAHHPGVQLSDIPTDMVTASGSGIDPHISVQGAKVQVERVAKIRGVEMEKIERLVEQHIEQPLAGVWGTSRVNVLKLNIALDQLK